MTPLVPGCVGSSELVTRASIARESSSYKSSTAGLSSKAEGVRSRQRANSSSSISQAAPISFNKVV